MNTETVTMLCWFVAGSGVVLMVDMALRRRKNRAQERMDELSTSSSGTDELARRFQRKPSIIAQAESEIARRSKEVERKDKLKTRIVQAGLYQKNASAVFAMVRAACFSVPVVTAILLAKMGFMSGGRALLIGILLGAAGTLLPSFWLDHVKRRRQKMLRRALPDALDIITVCLEGGMSLSSSLSRVARELATAHPTLALELAIVERETQMGRTTGEAMRAFAERFDLEEVRSLSSVVSQAEKFGSSVTKAMETYAETMRTKRHQKAEEAAQKAVVKIIFPTLLCIFPGIFVVVLGPAAIRVYHALVIGSPLNN